MSKTQRKDRVLFTRCDEEFYARVLKLSSRVAKEEKRPVSISSVVRKALERELEKEGL